MRLYARKIKTAIFFLYFDLAKGGELQPPSSCALGWSVWTLGETWL